MLQKLLLSTAMFAASIGSAYAADLPARRSPPVYIPPPAPVFTWTGLYIGGNAGYAFDNKAVFGSTLGGVQTIAGSSSNGFTGGGQIGYNMQIGNAPLLGVIGTGGVVLGVEADAAYVDVDRNFGVGGVPYLARTDFVGTARVRLGVAFGDVMLFTSGGFAYGSVGDRVGAASTDKIATGWAYGGGVEYAIPTTSFVNFFHSSAVTLKAEYLRYDLGSTTLSGGGVFGSVRNSGNLVRGGINYKLDLFGTPTPVVARF